MVLVLGPQSMSHTLTGVARNLVPVEMEWGNGNYHGDGSSPLHIRLSAAG